MQEFIEGLAMGAAERDLTTTEQLQTRIAGKKGPDFLNVLQVYGRRSVYT